MRRFGASALAICALAFSPARATAEKGDLAMLEKPLDVQKWSVIERESGPVSYYTILREEGKRYIRGAYRPGLETVVLGLQLGDRERERTRKVRWSWRALALPTGGNACVAGKGDNAAAVYVSWKRGLRWYTLKYVWTNEAAPGTVCRSKRSAFAAQDTIVLRSGGPLGSWQTEEVDVEAAFREHFAGGDERAGVPELAGIGIMTDGDQTRSVSAADYADFVLLTE